MPGNFPTIQAAINGVPTGSTIDVAPGTYPEALVVTTGAKSFTVRGVGGAGATVVDAFGKNAPALTVNGASGTVVFSGITFRRGAPPAAAGGGFVITNASPAFFNCIFESNTASGGAGGAMFGSNATFSGCIIRNNSARGSGGGVMIMSGSRPVFSSTDIINNISGTTQPDGVGGGVDSRNSSPTFRGSHINSNTGKFAGGGIYHAGNFGSGFGLSTLVMEDSDVSANVASPFNSAAGPAEGGGIHIEDNAFASLTRVHVVGNRANSGGGLNAYRARYDVVDSTIDGNLAQNRTDGGVNGPGLGGGIYAHSHAADGNGPVSVVNLAGTLVRNSVGITGGGIVVTGDTNVRATLTLTASVVDKNKADGQGGGILVSNANLSTSNSLIIRNNVSVPNPNTGGQVGGGIDITTNSTASINTTTIANNVAGTFGGGIFVDTVSSNVLNMNGSRLYENTAGVRGGGLFVGGISQTGTIQSSIVGDNHGGSGQIQEEACTSLSYQGNIITGAAFTGGCDPGGRATGTSSAAPHFVHFLATPRAGTSTTLAWSVGRATSITVAGVGTFTSPDAPTGTIDRTPTSSTTYSLTAVASSGGNYTTPTTAGFTFVGPPPPPPPPPTSRIVDGDFNGDGRADFTVFRPSNGNWLTTKSSGGTTGVQWGNSADVIVPGDYDGDRKTDVAVFRPSNGTWLIVRSSTGVAYGVQWGNSADVPVPGDYDGDGKTDVAVFRPSNGQWLIINSSTGAASGVQWGNGTDRPVPGDYDGDRKTDVAVFRPSTGVWFIVNSSNGSTTGIQWGGSSDIAVPGDYDGDGKNDAAIFRPGTGTWYIVRSSNGAQVGAQWGNSADIPVPGDFDGDGKTDVAVFRPSDGNWLIVNSSTGGTTGIQWGNGADIPVLKRP